jgi:hypothetical protein
LEIVKFYTKKEKSTMAVNPVQVEKFLKGVDYPAKKEDLIKHAQQQGADQRVLETLKQLPDQTFGGPVGVGKAIGEIDQRSKGSP